MTSFLFLDLEPLDQCSSIEYNSAIEYTKNFFQSFPRTNCGHLALSGKGEREKKGERQQGEQAHHDDFHSPAIRQQAARHPAPPARIGEPSDGRPGPSHLSCTQPRCHPPL